MIKDILKSNDFKRLMELYNIGEAFNVFKVIGIETYEIRHSNVLAWLMDKTENHGFKELFLTQFLKGISEIKNNQGRKLNLPEISLTEETYSIHREWAFPGGFIDLLLEFPNSKVVMVIENKLGTTDAEEQLDAYKKITSNRYSEFKKIYVYLTPHGDPSQFSKDSDWLSYSYEQISHILKNDILPVVKDKTINDFIRMYNITVQKYLLNNEVLLDLASKLYADHTEFFDSLLSEPSQEILNDLSPEEISVIHYVTNTKTEIARIFYEIAKEMVKNHQYLTRSSSLKNNLLFNSEAMQKFCTQKFGDSLALCCNVSRDDQGFILALHGYTKVKGAKELMGTKMHEDPALLSAVYDDGYITRYFRRLLVSNEEIGKKSLDDLKSIFSSRLKEALESDLRKVEQAILK